MPPVRFDVVVPAFNEEHHVDACLDAILAQDHPAEAVHVYVVDAGSEDDTAAVVQRRAEREGGRITLLTGLGRLNAAEAFNAGYRAGERPWIARVDAHTYIAPDYLSKAAEAIEAEDERLGCVGGQPEQVGETDFGRAVALARRSRFGVGGSIYSDTRERAYVDTVQGGVYSRAGLDDVDGFATTFLVGEDEEVNWRLKQASWTILLDTALRFRYTTRGTWKALFRQHRNYGQSRVRVVAAHPDYLRPRHLAPAALVGGLGVLALVSRRAFVAASGAYAAAAVVAGRQAAGEGGEPELATEVAKAFSAMHFGYGVGLIEGAVHVGRARLAGGELQRAVKAR